jgi:septation ring formation regulator EzrA
VVILMTLLSLLVIAAFIAVLVVGLVKINEVLESIGGERVGYSGKLSDLGLISFGVRAIEQQTSHLGPALNELNDRLARATDGLQQVERNLSQTLEAVERQREG